MHPAYSVIVFTTASGAGYGLLFGLALFTLVGGLPEDLAFWLGGAGLAFAMVTFGLLASTVHLGHPERAWRALSQWRSSWLSREGVAALLSYPVAGLFALDRLFAAPGGDLDGVALALALATLVMCAATVASTAMIYVSLGTIRRWSNGWVLPGYLLLGLATGLLWLNLLVVAFGGRHFALGWLVVAALAAAGMVKIAYWFSIERDTGGPTPESATGLGGLGTVRLLDAPHTSENYIQKEMGYVVARRHADKLRHTVMLVGVAAPIVLTIAALALDATWGVVLCAFLAAAAGSLGAVVERWLFFAEAKHSVMLYYGAPNA